MDVANQALDSLEVDVQAAEVREAMKVAIGADKKGDTVYSRLLDVLSPMNVFKTEGLLRPGFVFFVFGTW